jgi:hypothetical protein
MLLNNTITLQQKILHHPQMMQDFFAPIFFGTPCSKFATPYFLLYISCSILLIPSSLLLNFGTLLDYIIISTKNSQNKELK